MSVITLLSRGNFFNVSYTYNLQCNVLIKRSPYILIHNFIFFYHLHILISFT